MLLTQAIHALVDGAPAIVSVIGKRYTIAELAPKKLGDHVAVFNDVGMKKEEMKGDWIVCN